MIPWISLIQHFKTFLHAPKLQKFFTSVCGIPEILTFVLSVKNNNVPLTFTAFTLKAIPDEKHETLLLDKQWIVWGYVFFLNKYAASNLLRFTPADFWCNFKQLTILSYVMCGSTLLLKFIQFLTIPFEIN